VNFRAACTCIFHGVDAAEVAAIIQRRPQNPGNGEPQNRQRRASVGG